MHDKYLIYRVQTKRDAQAYAELYDTYVAGVFRFVAYKVGSREEAEDITSEAFLRTWHYLLERRDVVSFTGLVYRIARNLVIDHYRSRKQHVSFDEAIEVEIEDGAELVSDAGEQIRLIDTAVEAHDVLEVLKKMKADYRDVMLLRYVDDLSVSEIAEILNKSHVHVRVLLHRATKLLQQLLSEHTSQSHEPERVHTTDENTQGRIAPDESASGVDDPDAHQPITSH